MGKEYIYHNYMWKSFFANINSNRIYPRFKKGEQFAGGFYSMTFHCGNLPSYTIKNKESKLYLSIKDNGDSFEFKANWTSTKMKAAFLEIVFNEIVHLNKVENEYVKWRESLFDSILAIKGRASEMKLVKSSDNQIDFSFIVHLKQLQATHEPDNFIDPKFIVELGTKSPYEVYKIGISYIDHDNKKCIGILKTILDESPIAGLMIGIAYFKEGKSELSSQYINRALEHIDFDDFDDDFKGYIAEIIATNDYNRGIGNDSSIRNYFEVLNLNQSGSALIKLSYIILSKNIISLKSFALENVSIAISYNENDKNLDSKIAGFHIICSVLLWNDKFVEAERYHHYFLNEGCNFVKSHFEHIESYIILAIAKNNINFISNMFLDYPHLKILAKDLFKVWELELSGEFFVSLSPSEFLCFNKIYQAKKMYC